MSTFAVQDMTQSDIILGLYPKEDPKFCLDFADERLDKYCAAGPALALLFLRGDSFDERHNM